MKSLLITLFFTANLINANSQTSFQDKLEENMVMDLIHLNKEDVITKYKERAFLEGNETEDFLLDTLRRTAFINLDSVNQVISICVMGEGIEVLTDMSYVDVKENKHFWNNYSIILKEYLR